MNEMQDPSDIELRLIRQASAEGSPINGSLELLPLCNMDCSMCYVRLSPGELSQKGELAGPEKWLGLAEQMKKAGTLFLLLTGGEPLLYSDFRLVYEGLRKLGMIITINTNGTLIDEEWAEYFGRNKPRRINVTLYGSDADTYERLCGYREGYDRAVRGVRLLKKSGVDVKINFSATPANAGDIDDIRVLARKLGVPVNAEAYMYPSAGNPDIDRLSPRDAAAIWHGNLLHFLGEDGYASYRDSMLEMIGKRMRGEVTSPDPDMVCMAGSCSFSISWQGIMRPCVMMDEPGVSVFEAGFEKAWDDLGQRTKKLRLESRCRECRLRPLCRVCVANCRLESRSQAGEYVYLCELAKESFRLLKE